MNRDHHQLLANLHRRARELQAGMRSEIVTGLVVQGGSSRGVYSIAVLRELQQAGLAHAFDHLFGASTGALNASCLLSEQTDEALAAYLHDLTTRRFVNFFRFRNVVDIDFIVDEVMPARGGLRVEKILQSASTLHVVLTDAATRQAHVVTNRDPHVNWLEVLRATMALPFLYRRRVPLNGREYIDGCVVEPVPLLRAIAAGCTDILVVLTIPPSFRTQPGWLLDLLERPLLRQYPRQVRELIRADRERFNRAMDHIEHPHCRRRHVRLHVIHPSDPRRMVSATTTNARRLHACAEMGRRDALQFLQPVANTSETRPESGT